MSQLNGLALIDKPTGVTSHDVVARLRRILRQKSIGHTGTLDPLATGLMIVVLGDATKLSDYLMAEDKAYRVTVRLGRTTDSLDRTGQTVSEAPVHADAGEITNAIGELSGEFEWPIPLFSAAKVAGQKLYEHGHAGRAVAELPTKLMTFWNVNPVTVAGDLATVDLECGKGAFVRTWSTQLGQRLGCGGCVEELRRTRVGGWRVEEAVTLEQLEAAAGEFPPKSFLPMNAALPGLRAVLADAKEGRLVGNGQIPHTLGNRLVHEQKSAFAAGKAVFVKVVSHAGDLLAILAAEPGQGLKIKRVFRSFP